MSGGVMICPPSLTSFHRGAMCAFNKRDSSNWRAHPVRRLRFARTEMFQVLQFPVQARELFDQIRHSALHRVSQDFRRGLGAQVDDELATLHGFFKGL